MLKLNSVPTSSKNIKKTPCRAEKSIESGGKSKLPQMFHIARSVCRSGINTAVAAFEFQSRYIGFHQSYSGRLSSVCFDTYVPAFYFFTTE